MEPSIVAPPAVVRSIFYRELHQRFARQAFDNWVVWAGNGRVEIGGVGVYINAGARLHTSGSHGRAGARSL